MCPLYVACKLMTCLNYSGHTVVGERGFVFHNAHFGHDVIVSDECAIVVH